MSCHQSVRPYVHTPDDLYNLMHRWQAKMRGEALAWLLAVVALMAIGQVAPGVWGFLAFCFVPVASIGMLHSLAEYVASDWFMHLLTLNDLIQPREDVRANFWANIARAAVAVADRERQAHREQSNGHE